MREEIENETGLGQVEELGIQGSSEAGHFLLFDHGLLDLERGRKILYGLLVLGIEFFRFLMPDNELFQMLPLIQGARSSLLGGPVHLRADEIQENLGCFVSEDRSLEKMVEAG